MEKLIMGIDPGTNFMGYAILKTTGKNCKPELVVSGVVDMKKMSDPYLKLQRVFQRTLQVIDSYHPDELAIESQFYGKNIQSMLKLGRAQGVAIAAARVKDVQAMAVALQKAIQLDPQLKERASTDKEFYPYAQESIYLDIVD